MKIEQVAAFRSCLTCAYRKFYPASAGDGKSVFDHCYCHLAMVSSKSIVKPQDVCPHWTGMTVDEL
jgi:hypothetical protein